MNEAELKTILESHRLWLRGGGGERADLSGADLRYASLSGANLSGANLRGANLRDANLSGADLSGANLRDANLSGANLSDANLSGANLSDANLSGADLRYANLRGANLSGADLSDARLNWATGNMAEIKTLLLEVWPVTYTSEYLHIGCERHLISEWWDFDAERISRMDPRAAEWWAKWKDYIRQTIEMSPAKTQETKQEAA